MKSPLLDETEQIRREDLTEAEWDKSLLAILANQMGIMAVPFHDPPLE